MRCQFSIQLIVAGLAVTASAFAGGERLQPPRVTPHEDCLQYDPEAVRIEPGLDRTWLLTDGQLRMATFEKQLDASNALAVARRHTAHCFIGRRVDRLPGIDVIEYWQGTTSTTPLIAPESCIAYVQSLLESVTDGANGWLVTDRARLRLRVTDSNDATILMSVARQFTAYCTIGYAPHRRFPHNEQPLHYWR